MGIPIWTTAIDAAARRLDLFGDVEADPSDDRDPARDLRRPRVLLVDDEEDVRLLVSHILADTGYQVDTVVNGREALRRIAESKPDLVLLDLMMPELDGWQVLSALRESLDAPPVLVLSAYCDDRKAADLGARGWIRKPFDYRALLSACSGILEPEE
ncbi:MAG: response regulator [Vicinamibacteria bacterium]|jgi:two-component system OmpR family response regulator|nr:response regulator [Vicinamibacteria bacterium]